MQIGEERVYIVPLRDAKKAPRRKRATRATRMVRAFVKKHAKTKDVTLSKKLNEKVWERGIEHPPSRIRIKVKKEKVEEEEVTTADLAD